MGMGKKGKMDVREETILPFTGKSQANEVEFRTFSQDQDENGQVTEGLERTTLNVIESEIEWSLKRDERLFIMHIICNLAK